MFENSSKIDPEASINFEEKLLWVVSKFMNEKLIQTYYNTISLLSKSPTTTRIY